MKEILFSKEDVFQFRSTTWHLEEKKKLCSMTIRPKMTKCHYDDLKYLSPYATLRIYKICFEIISQYFFLIQMYFRLTSFWNYMIYRFISEIFFVRFIEALLSFGNDRSHIGQLKIALMNWMLFHSLIKDYRHGINVSSTIVDNTESLKHTKKGHDRMVLERSSILQESDFEDTYVDINHRSFFVLILEKTVSIDQ